MRENKAKTLRKKTWVFFLCMLTICFRSMFHITMLAVPHLIKTKGSIVNVSSVNGIRSVSLFVILFFFSLQMSH